MNSAMYKNNWFKLLLFTICIPIIFLASCKKVEEPVNPVGQELPYTNSKKKLTALMDSIPQASLFRAAFKRSTIQAYMDSLNTGSTDVSYTIFLPTDQAFAKMGYDLNKINSLAPGELNLLLGYLILPGNIAGKMTNLPLETTFYPLIHPDPIIERTEPTVFSDKRPYYYALSVGFSQNSLLLNGKNVKDNPVGIMGSNGTILMIDSLVKKPEREIYQVINADTSLSFYMAALQKSNTVYAQKGLDQANNIRYNDTTWMMLRVSSVSPYGPGSLPFAIVFAPNNNAFRKAGFHSIRDIETFIDGSALATGPDNNEILTNMDSILVNHRFLSNFSKVNTGLNYLYTPDLRKTAGLDNDVNLGVVSFKTNNGTVSMHRLDFPNGRAANIIQESDINTLNGVVHHVDNLLLPTP